MVRGIFLLASFIIAGLCIGASASAQSLTLSEFLNRCETDQAFCQDEVAKVERMSNAIPGTNCPPEGMSSETMTSSVVGQLKGLVEDHPENASVDVDNAIDQVLTLLWPCSN